MKSRNSFISVFVLPIIITLAAMFTPLFVHVPPESFFPPSFLTHSVMLVLSLAAMWFLSKGRLALYGFTKGTYRFSPRIFLWILPTTILSLMSVIASKGRPVTGQLGGSMEIQVVLFIWIYASVSEELLTRGLLQTLLSKKVSTGAMVSRRLSMPVLVSGLFFGAMHIGLIKSMGFAALPVILLTTSLGLVTAWYREKTGSLLPAIIIHMLFNIGGIVPLWVIRWLYNLNT